jgi:transcriptional regulator with XRE-family HTH domain
LDHFREYLAKHFQTRGAQARLSRDTGISQATLSTWVNDRADTGKPSSAKIDQVVAIARALGLSLDFLLAGQEYWTELQDQRIKELLEALRGLPLDPRLPLMCREFLALDNEDRELAFDILKLCRERKQKGRVSDVAATASGAG